MYIYLHSRDINHGTEVLANSNPQIYDSYYEEELSLLSL